MLRTRRAMFIEGTSLLLRESIEQTRKAGRNHVYFQGEIVKNSLREAGDIEKIEDLGLTLHSLP